MKTKQFDIAEIVQHYLAAAAWSTSGGEDDGGNPEHESLEAFEFSEEALKRARKDCVNFVKLASELLVQSGLSESDIGHNFWLTREGHGVGFWDRDLGDVGDALTEIAHKFGSGDLYLGDDELLYFL